jgi:hypothetical protein
MVHCGYRTRPFSVSASSFMNALKRLRLQAGKRVHREQSLFTVNICPLRVGLLY